MSFTKYGLNGWVPAQEFGTPGAASAVEYRQIIGFKPATYASGQHIVLCAGRSIAGMLIEGPTTKLDFRYGKSEIRKI